MIIALIVLVLFTLAYWRSLLKMLLAVVVALVVIGGIQVLKMVGSINPVPSHQLSMGHSATQSTIAAGSLGVGTRPSITFTRNSTAKLRA
jgi:hypothetical protein